MLSFSPYLFIRIHCNLELGSVLSVIKQGHCCSLSILHEVVVYLILLLLSHLCLALFSVLTSICSFP